MNEVNLEEQVHQLKEQLRTCQENYGNLKQENQKLEHQLQLTQRNYRKLAGNIPLTDVFLFDTEMRFLIADGNSIMHTHGMEPEDIEGSLLQEVFIPEIFHKLKPLYEAALNGETIIKEEEINSEFFQFQCVPLFDELGNIEGGLFVSSNVTQYHKAQNAIFSIKEDLEKAHKLANIGNWQYDIVSQQFTLSPVLRQFLNLHEDKTQMNFQDLVSLFKPLSGQKLRLAIHEAKETGRGFDMELQLAKKPTTWIRAIAKDYDRSDLIYKITGIFQNITQAKEAEYRQLNYQQGLKTLNNIGSNPRLSFSEQLDNALTAVSDYLRLPVGLISRVQGESFQVTNLYSEIPTVQFERDAYYDLNKTLCKVSYQSGEAVAIPSVKQSVYRNYDCYQQFKPESFISAPIYVQGELYGVVSFFSPKARENDFTEEDAEFIGIFARSVGATIEREKHEQELILAKNVAEEASLAKAQFLSTMSHEIRTPMNAVLGITHILMQDNPRPDQEENLNVLRFSGENLLALINDILDFSKIEAGKINFEEIDIDLHDLAYGIRDSLIFRAKEKRINLSAHLDKNIPKPLIGDSTRLSQILNNLVGNAIKFTDEGSVDIRVSLLSQTESTVSVKFEVQDTGIGIAEDKQAQIFESFSQASVDTTRKYGGTGLGLAITKKLLELQNSQIQIESKIGEGALFYFILDFKISLNHSTLQRKAGNIFNTKATFEPLTGYKILLVEDNSINVIVANKFLKKWEVEITHVENGEEAVKQVQNNDYDLVLMDLQMPVMDGYTACRNIRTFNTDIPIIALTASVMQEIQDKVVEVGMTDFITKPLNPNELYLKMIRYIGKEIPSPDQR